MFIPDPKFTIKAPVTILPPKPGEQIGFDNQNGHISEGYTTLWLGYKQEPPKFRGWFYTVKFQDGSTHEFRENQLIAYISKFDGE